MALPKIVESDPWLEEDEDCSHKSDKERPCKRDFTSVTKIVKVSVYIYLVYKLLSRSSVGIAFLTRLYKIASGNILTILFILSVSFLKRLY